MTCTHALTSGSLILLQQCLAAGEWARDARAIIGALTDQAHDDREAGAGQRAS